MTKQTEFNAGDLIIRQGDPSDVAYVIEKGRVEVFRAKAMGGEEHLSFLGAGQIFGEYGVLDMAPRSASVRALEKTKLRIMRLETEDDE